MAIEQVGSALVRSGCAPSRPHGAVLRPSIGEQTMDCDRNIDRSDAVGAPRTSPLAVAGPSAGDQRRAQAIGRPGRDIRPYLPSRFSGPRPEEPRLWRRVSKDAPERAGNGGRSWNVLRDARPAASSGRGCGICGADLGSYIRPEKSPEALENTQNRRGFGEAAEVARRAAVATLAALLALALPVARAAADPDALWRIVHGSCLPHAEAGKGRSPASGSISPAAKRRASRS